MQVLYINLLEIKYLRKHTVVFRENRHRTSIFHCKSCAKTGIQSCAKSDSGAKFSLKITGRVLLLLLLPTIQETKNREFLQPLLAEGSAKGDVCSIRLENFQNVGFRVRKRDRREIT